MTNSKATHVERRLSAWLFVSFVALYALTSGGRLRVIDEYEVFWMAQSLVERGNLAVPQALELNFYFGKIGLDGQPYTPYGPVFAILSVPSYLFGAYVLHPIVGSGAWPDYVSMMAAVPLISVLAGAATVVMLFLLLRRLGQSVRVALLGACLFGLTTPNWAYATYLYNEVLQGALLCGAVLALLKAEQDGGIAPWGIAGVTLGLAVLVKVTIVLALPVFLGGAYFLTRRDWRRILPWLITPILVAGLLYAAYNAVRYGSPLDFGYMPPEGRPPVSFQWPWVGLFGLTVSPGKGLFVFAPLLIPIAWGWSTWRAYPLSVKIALVVALIQLAFYAHYAFWEGGYAFGPRYLVPIIPLLWLPIGRVLTSLAEVRWRQVAFVALTLLGLYVQVVGVSTSYLEDQAAGENLTAWSGNQYYTADFAYRLSYNPMVTQSALFFRYLGELLGGGPSPALGQGLDFWPFYLAQNASLASADVPVVSLLLIVVVLVVLWGISGLRLWQYWRAERVTTDPALAGSQNGL